MDDSLPLLARGQEYPFPYDAGAAGAAIQLLSSGNILQVFLPGTSDAEESVVRFGKMEMGLIVDQPLLLLVVRFECFGMPYPPLVLETTFDSRIVPDELFPFEHSDEAGTRLLLTVHLVDSASGVLKGLRAITTPPGLTQRLVEATREQLEHTGSMAPRLERYHGLPVDQLPEETTMELCGS